MKKIYLSMWRLAKPFYLKGRPMDVEHVKWMMKEAEAVAKKESLDESILLPLVILHDVGYANVPKGNPFNLDMRRAHMAEGKKIAEKMFAKLKYPQSKAALVAHYVSVHDSWVLGDNEIYNKDKLLGAFSDLDFIWMATEKGFQAMKKVLRKDDKEMLGCLEKDEKPRLRPFATKTTKDLFKQCLDARKKEILGKNL